MKCLNLHLASARRKAAAPRPHDFSIKMASACCALASPRRLLSGGVTSSRPASAAAAGAAPTNSAQHVAGIGMCGVMVVRASASREASRRRNVFMCPSYVAGRNVYRRREINRPSPRKNGPRRRAWPVGERRGRATISGALLCSAWRR